MNISIFISGSGSNMMSIVNYFKFLGEHSSVRVLNVICNNPSSSGAKWAVDNGIKTILIDHKQCKTRMEFEFEISKHLENVDFIVLAGFMRVLTEQFVSKWSGKIINIHPSILPSFKGAHAVRDAIKYGVKVTGTTIHYVTKGVDEGEIISQDVVFVDESDDEKSLHEKIKLKEQGLYPKVIEQIAINFNSKKL